MLGGKLFIQGKAFRNGQLNISIITMPVPSIFCGFVFMDAWHFFQPIKTEDLFTALSPCGRCAANYKCAVPIWEKKKKSTLLRYCLQITLSSLSHVQQGDVMIYFYLAMAKASSKMHADNDFRRQTQLCLIAKWQHVGFWSLGICKNKENNSGKNMTLKSTTYLDHLWPINKQAKAAGFGKQNATVNLYYIIQKLTAT